MRNALRLDARNHFPRLTSAGCQVDSVTADEPAAHRTAGGLAPSEPRKPGHENWGRKLCPGSKRCGRAGAAGRGAKPRKGEPSGPLRSSNLNRRAETGRDDAAVTGELTGRIARPSHLAACRQLGPSDGRDRASSRLCGTIKGLFCLFLAPEGDFRGTLRWSAAYRLL